MTGYTLTVTVPSMDTFHAYWYGYGSVTSVTSEKVHGKVWFTVEVDYGLRYSCLTYQRDRFASGLYFATVSSYSTSDLPS